MACTENQLGDEPLICLVKEKLSIMVISLEKTCSEEDVAATWNATERENGGELRRELAVYCKHF